jgi:hypothetical protein
MAGASRSSSLSRRAPPRRRAIAAAAAIVAIVAMASVLAVAPRPAYAAPKTLARSLTGPARDDYEAARTLFAHDDYAGAAVKFQSAYDRSHDPRLLWNIASCEHKLRRYARARVLLERYLDEGGDALTEQDRRDTEGVLRTIAPFISTVRLTASPEGADVVVDGETVGSAPLPKPLYVELGKHELVVRKDGFRPESRSIVASGGDTMLVSVTLVPKPHEGQLEVRAGRDDLISLDGKNIGIGSVSKSVPSGHHVLRVTGSGREPRDIDVTIEDDRSKTFDLRPTSSGTSTTTWLLASGGVVLAAAGLALGAYFVFRPSSTARGPEPTAGTLGAVELP